MSVELKITGLAEAREKLKAMEGKTSERLVGKALRVGAQVSADYACSIAPHKSGTFGESVVVRASRSRKNGTIGARVTFNKKLYGAKGFYGRFEDQGHLSGRRLSKAQFGYSKKLGSINQDLYALVSRARGRHEVPGSETLEKAYARTKEEAVDRFSQTIGELIAAELGG